MDDLCDITKNKYICATNINENEYRKIYTIKSDEPRIDNELKSTNYINFDTGANEISLTGNSSNHYFWADEKAHCNEKWQDWFCVPNYHNNNNVNKYPNTKTMSVGVCYNTCPMGYTVGEFNKCSLFQETNGELMHNPLAIIAIFGSCFFINKKQEPTANYNDISDTIGIRGSYLNDLYRVNNNNKFIKENYIKIAKTELTDATPNIPYSKAPTVVFAGSVLKASATAIVIDGSIKSIRMISGGKGPEIITIAPSITFTREVGESGTNAEANVILDKKVLNVIIDVGGGGTGYTIPPDVVFTGDGFGAYAIAGVTNGAVTTIKLISSGEGYTTKPTISFTRKDGGSGTDATANAELYTEILRVDITNEGTGYKSDTTTQEKLLLKIINKFVNSGRTVTKPPTNVNRTIKNIQDNIRNTASSFIKKYITTKNNDEALNKFLNKIVNYKFDINKLDKLYGKDKNGNRKFVNIIAYAYNIMCLVLYNIDTAGGLTIETSTNINVRINELILRGTLVEPDALLNSVIVKVFISACTNCFKVNFDIFDNYMKKHLYGEDIMCILKNGATLKFNSNYFAISKITEETSKIIDPPNYQISVYNNLNFYDHRLLSEYSENTRYIIQILILFTIGFAIVIFISLVYAFLIQVAKYFNKNKPELRFKYLDMFTYFINYIFLFYKKCMYTLIQFTCYLYYGIFCKYSKSNYTLVYFICNLSNLILIIFLIGTCFTLILELLNIDYIDLLTNIKFKENQWFPEQYIDVFLKFLKNSTFLYLIITVLYCTYLVRYGLNENQFDILSNMDAERSISMDYLNNIFISQYAANILSNIDAIYTEAELTAAANNEKVKQHIIGVEAKLAEEAAKLAEENALGKNATIVAGTGFGNAEGLEDAFGEGNLDGALKDGNFEGLRGALGEGDAKDLEGAFGKGDAKDLQDAFGKGDANGIQDVFEKGDANGLQDAFGDNANGLQDAFGKDGNFKDLEGALDDNAKGKRRGRGRGNSRGNEQEQQEQLQKFQDNNPEMGEMAGKIGFKF
jgi:hypothetical protein